MDLKKYTQEFGYNFKLAYPIILAMLGHTIVGIVDNIMVGKIGATELAAASLANSFIFIALSVGVGFSTAITPLIAASDTENDISKGRNIFINGIFLCTLLPNVYGDKALKPEIIVLENSLCVPTVCAYRIKFPRPSLRFIRMLTAYMYGVNRLCLPTVQCG